MISKIFLNKKLILLSLATFMLISCALMPSYYLRKKEKFENKSGIVGVLQVEENMCGRFDGEGSGDLFFGEKSKLEVEVKKHTIFGLFGNDVPPGNQIFKEYSYKCLVGRAPNFAMGGGFSPGLGDPIYQKRNIKVDSNIVIKVPENRYCKMFILYKNKKLYVQKNDKIIKEVFEENMVALDFDSTPYCEVEIQ